MSQHSSLSPGELAGISQQIGIGVFKRALLRGLEVSRLDKLRPPFESGAYKRYIFFRRVFPWPRKR